MKSEIENTIKEIAATYHMPIEFITWPKTDDSNRRAREEKSRFVGKLQRGANQMPQGQKSKS